MWSAADLDIDGGIPRCVTVEELIVPNYDRELEMLDGDNGQEKAIKLVRRMVELKLI